MICVVIKGPTYQEVLQQISEAMTCADLVELRLDCWERFDLGALTHLRSQFSIPMIFTLRSSTQGGFYRQSEQERLHDIKQLFALNPDYFDLEFHISPTFIQEMSLHHPEVKLILSHHDFHETPNDLEAIYRNMQKIPAHFYKIATTANNCLDALKQLNWAKYTNGKLIAISMGSYGQISRILAPIIGSPITYAALEEKQSSAPGQLLARILIDRYHYRSLNRTTAVYGLIGDPVDQSVSNQTHNYLIRVCGFNAVYVKMEVKLEELDEFLKLAKQLPFQGLSVTMPLKEAIIPFLDDLDPQARPIGAVNTLLFKENKIYGFNTDGMGALNAIEQQLFSVKDKRLVLLGAGGASKAIAYEAHRRGAKLTIVNRDGGKAIQLANRLNAIGKGLEEWDACRSQGYDLLINTTPTFPIPADQLHPQTPVVDIRSRPKVTPLLQCALDKNCPVIYGYHMFVEQALGQFNLWFKDQFNVEQSRTVLETQAKACVSLISTSDFFGR